MIVLGLLAVFHTDCYTPHGGTRAAKKDFPNGDIVLVISFAYSIDVSCGKKDYTITMQGRPTRWTHEEKSLLTTISFRTDSVTLVANPQAMKHIQNDLQGVHCLRPHVESAVVEISQASCI